MTIWIPKGEFPVWNEDYRKYKGTWKGNLLAYRTEIRIRGDINLLRVYRYMYHYFEEEGWKSTADGSTQFEHFYAESRNAKGGLSEIRIWWRMMHGAGGIGGNHPFLRWLLNVDVLGYGLSPKEKVVDGNKVKIYSGDVSIWLTSILDIDYQGWTRQEGSLLKILREYFIRKIYKRNIKDQEIELRRVSTRYVDDIKHFINMTRGSGLRVNFHPNKHLY